MDVSTSAQRTAKLSLVDWRAANGCVRESPADGNQALTWGEIRQGRLDNGVNDVYIYIIFILYI